jgi:hypothetical protein
MYNVRPMQAEEIASVARWMILLPLLQRYHMTEASACRMFEQAMTRGDLLLAADEGDSLARGFAWVMPQGAFGRSAYLRLIGVHPRLRQPGHRQPAASGSRTACLRRRTTISSCWSRISYRRRRTSTAVMAIARIGAIPGYVLPDVTELIFWKPYPAR